MAGLGVEAPDALRPGHDVQVVQLVAMRGAAGMIASGHEHDVAVLHGHALVERAVVGIDALEGKALRRIEPVVVGFLQLGLVRQIVGVVLMARVGGPAARGRDHLDHEQRMGGRGLGQDVVDVARVAAVAAHRVGDLILADQARGVVASARRRADAELELGGRLDLIVAAPGHIDRDRLLALERAHALADLAEVERAGAHARPAADQHQACFALAGGRLEALAGLEPVQLEADVPPAGALRRHPMDQALRIGRMILEQQISHGVLPQNRAAAHSSRMVWPVRMLSSAASARRSASRPSR